MKIVIPVRIFGKETSFITLGHLKIPLCKGKLTNGWGLGIELLNTHIKFVKPPINPLK